MSITPANFCSDLEAVISTDRLKPYNSDGRLTESEVNGTYAWNLALCESLYPALNNIEVSLRNSIHQAASREYGTADWFQKCLLKGELAEVNQLSQDLRFKRKSTTASDLVSNLTLGFWLSLFRTRYEQILWLKFLEAVFPHCPRNQRTRQNGYVRLDRIRRLRNRVFHHEPIWHLPDLAEQHRLILEIIGWISPAMLAMTQMLDRFDSVYTMGPQPYTEELDSVAQSWSAK